eukprot:202930-Chlamydomonas_euryale.AAC.1
MGKAKCASGTSGHLIIIPYICPTVPISDAVDILALKSLTAYTFSFTTLHCAALRSAQPRA